MRAFPFIVAAFLVLPAFSVADDFKPDDVVATQLSAEGYVTTQTARAVVAVQAAQAGEQAGKTRDAMHKAVKALANPAAGEEWRLTQFNRTADDTGLERWYAQYEARLPEVELGGLADRAKAASKAGMQLSIAQIDFSPTLAETEAVRASLRKDIYAQALAELARLNAALPGRDFRIAHISFGGAMAAYPQMMKMARAEMAAMAAPAMDMAAGNAEVAQRLVMEAAVTFAALAPMEPEEPAETPAPKTAP